MTWRTRLAPLIAETIEANKDKGLVGINKALRDAWPSSLGPRKHLPYKTWCNEIRLQLTKLGYYQHRPLPTPPGQMEMFGSVISQESLTFSEDSNWETPPEIFDPLHEEFRFTLDVCATKLNTKCEKFFSPQDDGLAMDWAGLGPCWMNPPYSRQISKWMSKALAEAQRGALVVCLVPVRTDTAWWQDTVEYAHEVRFIRGRLRFLLNGKRFGSAPFASAVVIFSDGATPRETKYSYR